MGSVHKDFAHTGFVRKDSLQGVEVAVYWVALEADQT